MLVFIVRRLLSMAVSIVAISVFSFILIELPPGSALDQKISQMRVSGADVSAEQIRAMEDRYGLRDPIYVKYTKWIKGVVHGDFGQSFTMDQPVGSLIWSRLGFSVLLSLFALVVSWGLSIPFVVYSATHRKPLPDSVIPVVQFI